MAKVVIGVDPHKRINAVVVLNCAAKVLGRAQFVNDARGVPGTSGVQSSVAAPNLGD